MKKLALGLLLSLAFTSPALTQEPECSSRMQTLLDQSGYAYKVNIPCKAWMGTAPLKIPRGQGAIGLILFAEVGDVGIIGIPVEAKAKLNLTQDLMFQLLRLNHGMDYLKVGLDTDGDLFVRSEFHLSSITPAQFNDTIQQVVAGSNDVYNVLKE